MSAKIEGRNVSPKSPCERGKKESHPYAVKKESYTAAFNVNGVGPGRNTPSKMFWAIEWTHRAMYFCSRLF